MKRGQGFWIAAGLFALLLYGVRGYVIDDTFIHLQFAKHVRDGQGLVFNLGDPVPASTSPLWPLLLGWIGRGGADLLTLCRVLSMAAGFFGLLAFARAAGRLLLREEHAVAAIVAWAANAWMVRWTASGMETALAVALLLAGWIVAWGRGEPATAGRRFAVGALWGAAALARPETALLLLLYAGASVVWPDGAAGHPTWWDRRRAGLAVLLGAAIPCLPYFVYAGSLYHTILPSTLAAKGSGAAGMAVAWGQLVLAAKVTGAVCAIEALACLALAPRFRVLFRHGDSALHLAIGGWVTLVPLAYAIRGLPVLSRYLLPLFPFLVLYGWWALEHFRLSRDGGGRRAVLVAALAASVAINLGVYARQVVPHTTEFTAGMNRTLIPWGRWLADHTPADALVATPDIGAVGYYSDRRVLDLGGLVTPTLVPLMDRMDYDELVKTFAFRSAGQPDYLIDRGIGAGRLLRESRFGPALTPLFQARTQSLALAKPGPVDYTLYRVDWARVDSLSPR